MEAFQEAIEHILLDLEQIEGTLILVGVCDDIVLRDHAIATLRERLQSRRTMSEFRYDPEHLSLLEAVGAVTTADHTHPVVSVSGLEELPRDKWSEAIKLLNGQRNRLGRLNVAVLLWVNRATLAEIAVKAADFYSWRSGTFFIEPPAGWDTLASARRGYLHALVTQNEFVNLQGLAPTRGGHIVQMRMADIFIPVQAEAEPARERLRDRTVTFTFFEGPVTVLFTESTAEVVSPKGKAGEYIVDLLGTPPRTLMVTGPTGTQSVPLHTVRESDRRGGAVTIADLLRERRAVVLGDPGAGKTTLLRHLAYTLAHAQVKPTHPDVLISHPDLLTCLPVYVRVGDYAQHLQHHPTTTIEEYAPQGCQARQLPLSEELLAEALAHNQVIFLLDGLDEVMATDFRRKVAEQLATFARRYPGSRMLVTSRIVGYRETQLGGEFAHFTIRPFAEAEIQKFAGKWYEALGEPDSSSAERLVKAITESPSVQRLAANPLLLTVIALIHWRGTKLPQHRAKLYSQAAETLVDQWMSYRRVSPEDWDVQETLQTLLPAIAWRLHETTSNGLIGEQALHSLLVASLHDSNPRLGEQDAHTRAAQFRRNVSEFSGIFLERGLDQDGRGLYGFLHLTFEEYFAGVHLAEQWHREGARVLTPLLHNARWTEVLLLAAGRLGEVSPYLATQFVQTILKADDQYENILHRNLLLAARCLADDVRVDAAVRHSIVKGMLTLYFAQSTCKALGSDVLATLSTFAGTQAEEEIVATCLERLRDAKGEVRSAAALALGGMGASAATPEVLKVLVACLRDAEGDVRYAAAQALGGMGASAATPEVLRALVAYLRDAKWDIQYVAAAALGRIGAAAVTPEVLTALVASLRDVQWPVPFTASWALGQIGAAAATPAVLTALVASLWDAEEEVRLTASRALGQIGAAAATPAVLTALVSSLRATEGEVRYTTAWALRGIGATAATPDVLTALVTSLRDAQWKVRFAAAEALGGIGATAATPDVLTALVTSLRDAKGEPRSSLADLIDGPTILDGTARSAAALALGQLGAAVATPEVLSALLAGLRDAEWEVRAAAAQALGRIGTAATPAILIALMASLRSPHVKVRVSVAKALGQMGANAATPEILRVLGLAQKLV